MLDLKQIFRTTEEQITPVEATISGNIPEWLEGSLIRVGPGVFDLSSGFTLNHVFDGYAVLIKFRIIHKKVEFSKRYLKSDAYRKAQKHGKPVYFEFGTRAYDDSKHFLARALHNIIPDITDNCNTSIVKIGNSYMAMMASANLRVIHPEDLDTGEKVDLYPVLGVKMFPRLCPNTLKDNEGYTYFFCSGTPFGLQHHILRVPVNKFTSIKAFKDAKKLGTIKSTRNVLIPSFGMTDKYIVLIESPLICMRSKIKKFIIKGGSLKDCLVWKPEIKDRFWFTEKETGKSLSTVYESKEAFFFTHFINTYEDNGKIIVDLICYDSADIVLEHLNLENLRNGNRDPIHLPQSRRFILPIIENIKDVEKGVNLVKNSSQCEAIRCEDLIQVTPQVICHGAHDVPTINMKYLGKKYRYYYASGSIFTGEYASSVIKVDVDNGEVKKWFAGDGQMPGEAMFIDKPNSTSEDDGILLVIITSSLPDDKDRLVILDASTMQLIASAEVPCHVPVGYRGLFINNDNK